MKRGREQPTVDPNRHPFPESTGEQPAYLRSVHTPSRARRIAIDVTITSSQSRERSVEFPGPASPGLTLSPLRRGGGDPCYLATPDGAIWRTSLMRERTGDRPDQQVGPSTIECEAWGSGATEFADTLPALLGADDDATGFAPEEPTIAAAHRRVPHLRLGRTGRVLESLIPAVLEQRVAGKDSFRAWRLLVTKFGAPAPGPAPARMRVPPPGDVWRRIPSWEFHRANVDPGRARTLVGCAQRATRWSGW